MTWVKGRGQEEVTSGIDLFLLLGSSPRSLKARVFASVLGIATCVERLSPLSPFTAKERDLGHSTQGDMGSEAVCLLSASRYLQAMFCFCPKLP